jgi:hypothetical protein
MSFRCAFYTRYSAEKQNPPSAVAEREKPLRKVANQFLGTESNSLQTTLTDLRQWVQERLSNFPYLSSCLCTRLK